MSNVMPMNLDLAVDGSDPKPRKQLVVVVIGVWLGMGQGQRGMHQRVGMCAQALVPRLRTHCLVPGRGNELQAIRPRVQAQHIGLVDVPHALHEVPCGPGQGSMGRLGDRAREC